MKQVKKTARLQSEVMSKVQAVVRSVLVVSIMSLSASGSNVWANEFGQTQFVSGINFHDLLKHWWQDEAKVQRGTMDTVSLAGSQKTGKAIEQEKGSQISQIRSYQTKPPINEIKGTDLANNLANKSTLNKQQDASESKGADKLEKVSLGNCSQKPFNIALKRLQDDKEFNLCSEKDKPLLVVNTASYCGYTHQYGVLEKMHKKYGHVITIIGFPSNDFGAQEPKSNKEIADFCKNTFGVEFIMHSKTHVKGSETNEFYKWLKEKTGKEPDWNFSKFIVNGNQVQYFSSQVNPDDQKILNALNLQPDALQMFKLITE